MFSLIVFIILSFSAAALGVVFTNHSLKTWYLTIKKPSWNPPNKVFAPVWSVLYMMMALAGWMVWGRINFKGLSLPMVFFFVQLILNAGWSMVFFGFRRPDIALLEIIFLWVFIILTTVSFWIVYWVAGVLFLPYLLWVSFALVLNHAIWRLNNF
ncbi:MAG: tryptophan-rich sensory protein [Candidatus Omnitrophica bacterium]|nr:tryptophan-rich sensory protein [Candidatus Omnitrophota bacterium]